MRPVIQEILRTVSCYGSLAPALWWLAPVPPAVAPAAPLGGVLGLSRHKLPFPSIAVARPVGGKLFLVAKRKPWKAQLFSFLRPAFHILLLQGGGSR